MLDPVGQEALHVGAFLERAHLVANHALQVVREAAAREQVRQPRREARVRRRIRILYSVGFCSDCAPMNAATSVFLRWISGIKPAVRQLRLAAIADRDLGRALHVDAAVVARERVHRQSFDRAARLDTADRRAPAVLLERHG